MTHNMEGENESSIRLKLAPPIDGSAVRARGMRGSGGFTSAQMSALLYLEFRVEQRGHREPLVSPSTYEALARRGLCVLGQVWELTEAGRAALPPLPPVEHTWLTEIAKTEERGLFIMEPALLDVRTAALNLAHRDLIELRPNVVDDVEGFLCRITNRGRERLAPYNR